MAIMNFGQLCLTLLLGLLLMASCGTGPAPKPITDKKLPSGEEVARQAGDAADDGEKQSTVLYETSRGSLDRNHEDQAEEIQREPAQEPLDDEAPTDEEEPNVKDDQQSAEEEDEDPDLSDDNDDKQPDEPAQKEDHE